MKRKALIGHGRPIQTLAADATGHCDSFSAAAFTDRTCGIAVLVTVGTLGSPRCEINKFANNGGAATPVIPFPAAAMAASNCPAPFT